MTSLVHDFDCHLLWLRTVLDFEERSEHKATASTQLGDQLPSSRLMLMGGTHCRDQRIDVKKIGTVQIERGNQMRLAKHHLASKVSA